MKWVDVDVTNCPVAATLAIVGDRWSLLVVRELLNGVRRFNEIAEHIEISPSVLSKKLANLEEHGLVERYPYQSEGERTRHKFALTAAGVDLRVIVFALVEWGNSHAVPQDRTRLQLVDRPTRQPVSIATVGVDRTAIDADEVTWLAPTAQNPALMAKEASRSDPFRAN